MVSFDDSMRTVFVKSAQLSSGPEKDGFTFDRVFAPGTQQHEVFDYGVKEYVSDSIPVVPHIDPSFTVLLRVRE